MRRFSQRSHLVTLSEINVTPLLDLAFVLLIIFMITTPLLEQGIPIDLPQGGQPDRPLEQQDLRMIEINPQGYFYEHRPVSLQQLEQRLTTELAANPNLVALIRADENMTYKSVFQVQDMCANLGVKVNLRSQPRDSQ